MGLVSIQVCTSNEPWASAFVMSHSTPGLVYELKIPFPEAPIEDYICECKGYLHRHYCSHQEDVILCLWNELDGPEKQNDEQRAFHICPRCGKDTTRQLEWKRNE